jgi:hypothetical protein
MPLFDQLSEKAVSDFVPSVWFLNSVLGKFITGKEDPDHLAPTHLLSTQGLLTRISTQGTTLHGLGRLKEGSTMTRPTI